MIKFKHLLPRKGMSYRVNSVDAWVPQKWANESIAILMENMVIGQLVYRGFENYVMENGMTVNTRKPGEFHAKRKGVNTNITKQDLSATNVAIKLNQHVHVSFIVKDREQAYAFADLVETYLKPAVQAIARHIDKMLLFQAPRFLRTDIYQPGSIGTNASLASILETRKKLNDNKCPTEERKFIISSKDDAALLSLDTFINADKLGDGGTAIREASLGRRLGFDFFMCQNTISVVGTSDTVTGAINNGAGYPAGTASITVDGLSAAIAAGTWFKVAGDNTPQRVVSTTGGSTPTAIVFLPGLKAAVVDDAVVTIYDPGAINLVAGYAAGWEEPIIVDGFTALPQVGQFVQFVANGDMYVVMNNATVDSSLAAGAIELDRPLEAALINDQAVFIGPNATMNLAFVRNAIALVSRPMALPRQGSGAAGAVANYGGYSIRVTWGYDMDAQGTIVTVDLLCGVQVLDVLLGQVMLT